MQLGNVRCIIWYHNFYIRQLIKIGVYKIDQLFRCYIDKSNTLELDEITSK